MIQPDNEESWYAFKIFFGKGKPIKAYFVAKGIEHIYDVKQEYWDKNKKKSLLKEVPIMHLSFFSVLREQKPKRLNAIFSIK